MELNPDVSGEKINILDDEGTEVSRKEFNALQLKQAKVWARIQEIEGSVLQQKEHIRIIEKSLQLGGALTSKSATPTTSPTDTKAPQSVSSKNNPEAFAEYKQKLAKAKKLFENNQFSQSALDFSKINNDYPNESKGEAAYWAGRSAFKLKEYNNAQNYFIQTLDKTSDNNIRANALYYLARSEINLGLTDAGKLKLQNLIKDYPYESAADAAKLLLTQLETPL